MRTAVASLNISASDAEVGMLVRLCDENADGEIDFDEVRTRRAHTATLATHAWEAVRRSRKCRPLREPRAQGLRGLRV